MVQIFRGSTPPPPTVTQPQQSHHQSVTQPYSHTIVSNCTTMTDEEAPGRSPKVHYMSSQMGAGPTSHKTSHMTSQTAPRTARTVKRISACTMIMGYIVMIVIIIACCLLYSLGTFANFWDIFYVTGYGALSIRYYVMTTIFAYLNRSRVNKIAKKCRNLSPESSPVPAVSIHVVGYREDPDYFRQCLNSVVNLSYPNLACIVVVVDGNDADGDVYMADIAREVFGDSVTSLDLAFIPSETGQAINDVLSSCVAVQGSPQVYVVTQPHAGKREAIYTAFLISKEKGVEFFVNTDSDTILNPKAVDELVYLTVDDDEVNAVAGRLKIFNKFNWLAYLTAARYFLAFNIERASQGYHGVVGCISGPLGLYRVSAVRLIVDEWVKQSFIGRKCTFGDDRHMTNKLLSLGDKILYTHRSFAETETPTCYARFVAQQTRWSKSYWRELVIQSGWATRHWYLLMETVYGVLFPVLITVTLVTVLFTRTWWSLVAIIAATFTMPFLRCLIVFVFFERNYLVLLGVFYPLMYFSTLLPVEFVALFTMGQNNWGTSSRKKIVNSYGPVIPVMMWMAVVIFALVWHGTHGPRK